MLNEGNIKDILERIEDKEIKRKHPLAGGLQGQSALLAAGLFLYSFLHPHNWRTSLHNPLSLSALSTSSPQLVHLTHRHHHHRHHHHHHHHYQRQHFDCKTFFFSSFLGFSHITPDLWSACCNESSLG